MTIAACVKCHEQTYVTPLHGEKGGPSFCPICAGKWHAEHSRRRKWGRIIIKAMKFYEREGGRWDDFDKLKLAASGIAEDFGIDLLGYGTDTIGTEVGDITAELLADTIQLTHPDKHPPECRDLATRVTQELLALKPFVFPAPKAKPSVAPRPRDDKIKWHRATLKEPSQEPTYPCGECADTIPYYYCTPCKTEYEKRYQEERERTNARQRDQYARRQRRRRALRPGVTCEQCETEFKPRRKDAKYCSHACRQGAYRQRENTIANEQDYAA